ncbi:P-loop containing nucleoside triphosphate hydrolase [Fusarium agapanthi]|uniref:P-loop containing nucleoside triphosphate hydrolase n=1 Tax=Fusarium agapanthi TaxID=1803897 RepID=A0A9P5BPD5_9HYPO|nr:P-loop containing nucleoside triphosphate hydrolase [Fusarium agapanthi]
MTFISTKLTMSSNAYIPNIYIIGPQSTGKTTLVNKLQAELEHSLADSSIDKPQIVSEVARTVLAKHKYSARDIQTSTIRCFELQQLILEAQASSEKEALETSSWFISDRSGFDPLVYAKRYAAPGAVQTLQQLPAWKDVKTRMERSLIVVCEAGTPWLMDDGVRLMPGSDNEWMQIFHDFCEILNGVDLEYFVVPRTVLDISERAGFVWARWTERRQSWTDNRFNSRQHKE